MTHSETIRRIVEDAKRGRLSQKEMIDKLEQTITPTLAEYAFYDSEYHRGYKIYLCRGEKESVFTRIELLPGSAKLP